MGYPPNTPLQYTYGASNSVLEGHHPQHPRATHSAQRCTRAYNDVSSRPLARHDPRYFYGKAEEVDTEHAHSARARLRRAQNVPSTVQYSDSSIFRSLRSSGSLLPPTVLPPDSILPWPAHLQNCASRSSFATEELRARHHLRPERAGPKPSQFQHEGHRSSEFYRVRHTEVPRSHDYPRSGQPTGLRSRRNHPDPCVAISWSEP